ncbi:putative DMT superfamily transporter inner membrane protein [Planctomycetes bacterium MalM25]|nr:putative DMT superfamily transporter inner membrane protein [Planctomycetes bacterium MalM25]
MAYVYFTVVCLFFGSNFILMDRATRWFGPAEVGFWRVSNAAALMAVLWATLDRRQRLRRRDLPVIGAIGLLANAYPYAAQPMLISSGFGHSFFGMTVAFTPLLTILVSIPMLGVKPTKRQMIGVLGGLLFVFLLIYDGEQRGIHLGLLAMAVTIPLSYAIGNTWIRRNLKEADPTPLSAFMMATASVTLAPLAFGQPLADSLGVGPPGPREGYGLALFALMTLGICGTGACVWAFVRMVQERGPLFAGMVTYVVPVIAMLWGLVDNETITTRQIIAIAGILLMVTLVQSPARTADPSPSESDEWQAEPIPADA